MSLQKTIIYNDSTDLINGNLILHTKDMGTTNPAVGTVYLYLKNNTLNVRKNGQIDVDLESGGGSSDPLLLSDGSASNPTYAFTNSISTGIFRKGTGEISVSVSGASIVDISSSDISFNKGIIKTLTGGIRSTNEYTYSSSVPSDVLTPYVSIASFLVSNGEGCLIIAEAVSKTVDSNELEPLKTMRSVSNVGGVITETPYIDEVISDSWRYSTSVPGSYILQLKAHATSVKQYTYNIRIYQTNNSNVLII